MIASNPLNCFRVPGITHHGGRRPRRGMLLIGTTRVVNLTRWLHDRRIMCCIHCCKQWSPLPLQPLLPQRLSATVPLMRFPSTGELASRLEVLLPQRSLACLVHFLLTALRPVCAAPFCRRRARTGIVSNSALGFTRSSSSASPNSWTPHARASHLFG